MVMMFFLHIIALAALVGASVTDMKTREVPDWISYGLIAGALGLRFLFSLHSFNFDFIVEGTFGFIVFLALGYIMYYTGQWGGGDSKLLMGIGAIFGLSLPITTLPLIVVFVINFLLAGAVYGVGWIGVLCVVHIRGVEREATRLFRKMVHVHHILGALTFVFVVLAMLVSAPFMIRLGFLGGAVLPLISFYLWILVHSVEREALYKRVHPNKLTVGDWLAHPVVVDGKTVASERDLGMTMRKRARLIELYKKKKISKVVVKNGIPFVPSFLIGYAITLVFGNWFALLL
jgi:Flp pilus assembly protein protease CpaA